MTERNSKLYDLDDSLAHEDIKKIAEHNALVFYRLKRDLVIQRQSLCSRKRIAELLKESVNEVSEFERYYSDPTVSELQAYALAVMCEIDAQARRFQPDMSRMYSEDTILSSGSAPIIAQEDEGDSLQIHMGEEEITT